MSLIFILTAVVSGTAAWADFSQHRTNAAKGEGPPKPVSARLQKYEKDAEGKPTGTAVPGAHFALYRQGPDGQAELLASFVTGADGQALASDLEPGDYYWQETQPAPGYLPELEDGQPKKYPFTVPAQDGEQPLSIVYNTRQCGSLTVTKTVAGEGADLGLAFSFTAVIGETTETFNLKHGQTKRFDNIPAGTPYQITEAPAAGYTTTSENSVGNVPQQGVAVTFTNTYVPQQGRLIVTKEVTGDDADLGRAFSFTAVIGGQTQVFTLKHGESKTFDGIPVGTAYAVIEADEDDDYYTPVKGEYTGTIALQGVTVTLPFVNHHDGPNPPDLPGRLEVTKTIVGQPIDTGKEFTFTVTFEGEGAPASPQTFKLKHGEKKVFADIPRGVRYTVTEAPAAGYHPDFATASGIIAWNQTAGHTFINRPPPAEEIWITVTKRVLGNPPGRDREKLFHFTLTIAGQAHEFVLKAGETSQLFAARPGDAYSLAERDYRDDDYVQSGVVRGAGTAGAENIEVTMTNTYVGPGEIDIEGEKTWQAPEGAQLPESVTILLKNGGATVRTTTTNQAKNWRYKFEQLPKHDAAGAEISYTVEEVRVPGWRPVVTGHDIENQHQPPVTDAAIEVEKAVSGTPPENVGFQFKLTPINGAPMPQSDEITVNGAGKAAFGQIAYAEPGVFIYTVTERSGGLPNWSYDASVYTVTVTVSEGANGQLKAERTLKKAGQPAEKILFTNHYVSDPEPVSVRVTKVWANDEVAARPESVQVQLYKDGTAQGGPATLSSGNSWTRVWTGLETGHTWTVDELAVPEGYTKTVSGDAVNGFTVTNTKGEPAETTSVKVTKVWKGEDKNRPASIAAQLYKDGEAAGVPATLSEANQWSYTWSQLEKGPEWTVDEVNVPAGYNKAVSGDAANGFVITNTKQPTPPVSDEEVTVSGKKTWNHGENPQGKRPASITVIVKADGAIVTQRLITQAEHWAWTFKLPKYNAGGKEIKYTIDEARFEDYVKTVDGYSLINTYKPGANTDDPTNPNNPNKPGPKTDDDSNLALWLCLLGVSLAGGIVTVVPWKKRKAKRKRLS